MAAWLVQALLVGGMLAAAARIFEECARLAGLPRRFVWLFALLATISLAAFAPFRSSAPESSPGALPAARIVDGGAVSAARPTAESGPAAWLHAVWSVPRAVLASSLDRAAAVSRAGMESGASRVFITLWLACSLALLLTFAATVRRFCAAGHRWPVREVAGQRVRVSPSAGPAVFGVIRPEIVVPEWLLGSNAAQQRLVVQHEREHVRGGDPMLLAVGGLALVAMPWHPVIWWMVARLRLTIELDCDARVLRRGTPPSLYGHLLVDIAGQRSGLPFGAVALAAAPSHLERRLVAMTSRRPRHAAARGIVLAVFASLLVFTACESELPSGPEIEAMDVADAERRMAAVGALAADRQVRYYVDGELVATDAAMSLDPDAITRIEVVRGEEAAIHVTTTAGAAERELRLPATAEAAERARRLHATAEEFVARADALVERRSDAHGSAADGSVEVRQRTVRASSSFDGILLVNDERRDARALARLRPDDIESIEVIKGPAAARLFNDPAAENGVIRVTLKPGASLR
jgi:beta-lactamase regulating signal transducer with metallopeptidase domain